MGNGCIQMRSDMTTKAWISKSDSNLVLEFHVGVTHILNCYGWLEVVEVRNPRSSPRGE